MISSLTKSRGRAWWSVARAFTFDALLSSRFDISKFPFRINPERTEEMSKWGLIYKSYLVTLNQRVQGHLESLSEAVVEKVLGGLQPHHWSRVRAKRDAWEPFLFAEETDFFRRPQQSLFHGHFMGAIRSAKF